MFAISDQVYLLDTWQITAASYREHIPYPPPAPAAPYGADASQLGVGAGAAGEAAGAAGEEAADSGAAAATTELEQPGKKRKRRSKYQPNAAEQEANERAAAAAPLLWGAVEALQRWMAARGCTSLLQLRQVSSLDADCLIKCYS